jgi:hypothetical protein
VTPRPFTGRAVPGSRHFDSLGMCLRAFELVRVWERQGFTGAMRDRSQRTERAASYLHRRVMRREA